MRRYDPTFVIQQEPPNRVGQVVSISPQFLGNVRFNGRQHRCWAATADTFAPNEDVTFVSVGEQSRTFLKASGGYPTRWPMRLKDWGTKRINNVFLRYILERNTKHYTYEKGKVVSVVSTQLLSVTCKDGRTRTLPVEYMGEDQPAYAFEVGDQCLIYSRSPGERVVIGFIDQAPREMAEEDDLGPWLPVSARSSPYGGVTFVLSAMTGSPRFKLRHYVDQKTYYDSAETLTGTPVSLYGAFAFAYQDTSSPPVPSTVFGFNLDGAGEWKVSLDFGTTWNTIPRPLVTPYEWFDSIGRMTDDGGNPILQYCYTTQESIPLPLGGVGARVHLVNMQYSGSYTTTECLFGPANEYHTAIVYRPDPAGLDLFHGSYADGSGQVADIIAPPVEAASWHAYFSLGTHRAEAANGAAGVWAEMNSYIYPALIIYRGTSPGITTKVWTAVPAECYMIRGVLANSVGTVDVLFQNPGPVNKIRRVQADGSNAYWSHASFGSKQVYCMAAIDTGRSYYGLHGGGSGKIVSLPRAAGA